MTTANKGTCFECDHCLRPEEIDRRHNMHLYGLGMCAHISCWGRVQGLPVVTRGSHCGKFTPMGQGGPYNSRTAIEAYENFDGNMGEFAAHIIGKTQC